MLRSKSNTPSLASRREKEPLFGFGSAKRVDNKDKSWDPMRDTWSFISSILSSKQILQSLATLGLIIFAFVIMCNLGNYGMNYKPKEKIPRTNVRQGPLSVGGGGFTGLYAYEKEKEEQEQMLTDTVMQDATVSGSQQQQQQQLRIGSTQQQSPEYEQAGMLMSQQAAAMDAGLMPNNLISNSAILTEDEENLNEIVGEEGNNVDEQTSMQVEGSTEEMEQQPATEVSEGVEPLAMDAFTAEGTGNPDLSLSALSNYKDSWDPLEATDHPLFWHIPKAGGSTVKDIIGTCHRFVMATEFGVTDGHDQDTEIAVVYPRSGPEGSGSDRSPFVNVDTTTVAGIDRAQRMGFADSGLAQAIVTPFIYEANNLFTSTAKGRIFTVFRHPIDRAISLFYYIQVADWEPTYSPELVNWSLEDYAKSPLIENNWMTRQLSNTLEGDLNDDHLKIAMEVIRRKFLVGLMTEIERTMERFERYFRWTYHVNPPNQEACRERLLSGGSNKNASGNKKEKPAEGSEAYQLLMWQNMYDVQLYQYIEHLFEEQEQYVADIPPDFRNIDATCCKCGPPTFPPEGFTCPLAIQN